jgi:hypothetical protein
MESVGSPPKPDLNLQAQDTRAAAVRDKAPPAEHALQQALDLAPLPAMRHSTPHAVLGVPRPSSKILRMWSHIT